MRRHPQWRKRLEHMIDQVERNPFDYGPDDCGPGWAGAAIVAVLDRDVAAPFRGRYRTALGALRLMRKSGHNNLADLLRALLLEATGDDCEIHPANARLGDLMAVPDETGFRFLLGICNGERILVRRPEGKGTMERTAATRAWRLGDA